MTKAERKVHVAMCQLNKAFAKLCKERGVLYDGRFSACRIPKDAQEEAYHDIFTHSNGVTHVDYSYYSKE